MSIDLNWETLTTGPDGDALALRIRDFIHDKFQTVKLPRFIKSVTVHGFEFGSIPPDLELKDITDPLPDFYEAETGSDDEDSSYGDDEDAGDLAVAVDDASSRAAAAAESRRRRRADAPTSLDVMPQGLPARLLSPAAGRSMPDLASPFLGMGTPGFMGGGPNRHYFQSHLATGGGFSGTQTPLAAVAGGQVGHAWFGDRTACSSPAPRHDDGEVTPSHSRNTSQSSVSEPDGIGSPVSPSPSRTGRLAASRLREKSSVSTLAANSRPPTRDALTGSAIAEESDGDDEHDRSDASPPETGAPRPGREPRVEDMQAVFRIRYAGDIKLMLTAVILLDYPMPSFVGIPIKLNITGLTFDGVGVLAHIRKRLHFCFLSPEDALAAVGPEGSEEEGDGGSVSGGGGGTGSTSSGRKTKFGGLLQEVKVESEIGEREAGKQSLKNVGKVERFVLEQVRRIFEDEFVYPSFWTFLV